MAAKKGFFLLCGEPGLHKSSQAAEAFQGACVIQSADDVLHYYETVMVPDSNGELLMPRRRMLLDRFAINTNIDDPASLPVIKFDKKGNALPAPVGPTLEGWLRQLLRQGRICLEEGEPPPFEHVIIDEGGEIWDRRFAELVAQCTNSAGAPDTRKAYGMIGEWTVLIGDLLKALKTVNIGSAVITHSADPDVESGKKGGPKFPSATVSKKLAAKSDGTLVRECFDEDGEELGDKVTRYYWNAEPSQHMLRKLRGLRPGDNELIRHMTLAKAITHCGWTL